MDWTSKQIWKNCIIATFMCVCGCSVGTMGTIFYLTGFHWFFVLLISFIIGYISCVLFLILWNTVIQKRTLKEAFKQNYKISLVSMTVMVLTENLISLIAFSKFTTHQIHIHSSYSLKIMILAMFFGFLLVLPYNYYQLQKNSKICH